MAGQYSPGHAGYDSSVGRWRDSCGRLTAGPCHEECEEGEDDYSCGCCEEEEDPDEEPLCGCYTRRPVDGY